MTSSDILIVSGAATLLLLLLLSVMVMLLVERRERTRRIRTAMGIRGPRNTSGGSDSSGDKQIFQGRVVDFMRAATERLNIMKSRQIRETRALLVSAGYRDRDAIIIYTFFKLVSPLAFLLGASLYVFLTDPIGKGPALDFAAVLGAALFGSKLPDIIIYNTRTKRLDSIRKALPDTLDMLVICAEAGLSSDAALKRVVVETGRNGSLLSDELNLTALELSFMPERRIALDNLAERVPLPAVTAFVNTIIQAEKYGTPLARAYKVLSHEQRTERMLRAEEKAGRLPATMTVPMMIFILPALFIVLIGPAVLQIMDNFIQMK